jgi:hypothetical protein
MLVPLLVWYGHGPTNYRTFAWWLSCLWCWGWDCQMLELADTSVSISSPFPTALNPIFSCHEPCKCNSMNTFCQLSTLTGSLCPSFRSDFVWELLNSISFLLDSAFHWASPIVCSDLNASYRWWPTCHTRPSVKTKVDIYMNPVDKRCDVFFCMLWCMKAEEFVELAGSRYWNHWNWGGPELYVNAG